MLNHVLRCAGISTLARKSFSRLCLKARQLSYLSLGIDVTLAVIDQPMR